MTVQTRRDPDARGYFGEFGGRFVPETLVEPIEIGRRADVYWHRRRRQRLLAASASHGIPEALVLNAIFLSTRRAGYDNPSIVELKISHEAIVSRASTTSIAHLQHASPVEVRTNGRS